jgi:outer membrane protein OmpA-like peptidoglycan-associated protein
MRGLVPTALLLLGWTTAEAEAQAELGGTALALDGRVVDLVFAAQDLRFTIIDTGGQAQALNGKETPTEIRIDISADVLFDFDKAAILPKAAGALGDVATLIKEKGQNRAVRIEGHTDARGGDAYNQKLSERRADAVKQYLVQKEGLSAQRIATQGFGAKSPVASNTKPDGSDDPEGRQKNRRVEIVLVK